MKRKKTLALLLALTLALGLAACGQKAADGVSPSPEASPSPSGAPELLPDNAIDVTQATLGFPGDTTMLTVNGEPVPAETYLYWLGNMAAYYSNLHYQYYYTDLDFSSEISEGKTWDDQIKELAYQNCVLLATTPALAGELGVSLTDEELQEVYDQRAEELESLGEATYAYRLQAIGISDRADVHLRQVSRLFQKVEDAYESNLLNGVGEDAITAQAVADYAAEHDLLRAKHILLRTVDDSNAPLSDEEVAAARAKIDGLAAQLAAADDPIALFDALMSENSQDPGLASYPDGYLFSAGEMVSEFEEGTRALEPGGISPVIESSYGYHIILRLDPDCDEVRQTIAQDRFSAMAQSYVESAQVETTPQYEAVTTADYYAKLLAFQDTLEDPSASDPPELETYEPEGSTPVAQTPTPAD